MTSVPETLPGELEAIADAAAQRLRAQTADDEHEASEAQEAVIAAAAAAMAAGRGLAEIAAAEQTGQARMRNEIGKDLLRAIERTARRRREIEHEYHDAIQRAGRAGLAHRDIAGAAGAAPGTIRSLLTRPRDPVQPHRDPASSTSLSETAS